MHFLTLLHLLPALALATIAHASPYASSSDAGPELHRRSTALDQDAFELEARDAAPSPDEEPSFELSARDAYDDYLDPDHPLQRREMLELEVRDAYDDYLEALYRRDAADYLEDVLSRRSNDARLKGKKVSRSKGHNARQKMADESKGKGLLGLGL